MKGKSESVKVAVRVRPMNKREIAENSQNCVDVDTSTNQISVTSSKHETKTFQFDYVYPLTSTQREVYDQVAFPIVESIFQGYNGTVFAYGQTGCGKTFTMMGVVNDPNLKGVIPNAFDHIFGYIGSEGSSKKFLVRCSFVEIYNEEVRDLLGESSKALEVREDPKKGTFVKGLSYYPLKNADEIVKCLDKGNANRHVGATSMNDKSSRSHSLFTVYVEIEEGEDEKNKKIRSGKLNLVDLAGSERVGKTNATGQTFDEAKKINLSLTALGSVIDALSSNRKHIPYKDSKLTRLLADSLGGNTKTVMFANVSPASFNYDETVGTLRYASRAKLIKNAPKINEDPKDALLRQYEEQIKLLKEQLEGKVSPQPQIIEKIVKVRDEGGDYDNEEKGEKVQEQFYSNNNGQMNDDEKEKLLQRIAELEKEMIGGGSKENDHEDQKNTKGLEKLKEQKNKFKEYRKRQLKNIEEMEIKLEKIKEEKRKEEESLMQDVNKLRNKIKYLEGEIEDLKYDNEKDRTDFFENIKDLNKDNAMYKGIIKYLLSEAELRKIIEMSKYNEENESWRIHPFYLRNKKLMFPNIKGGQIPDLIENELNNREVVYDDVQNREKSDEKVLRESKRSIRLHKGSEDQNIPVPKFKTSREKFVLNAKNKNPSNIYNIGKVESDQPSQTNVGNTYMNSNTTNINMILMNKKEKERYEQLSNMNRNFMNNPVAASSAEVDNMHFKSLKKGGKFILDPLNKGYPKPNINNNNKLEFSIKATVEFGGQNPHLGNRKPKIKLLGPIQERNKDEDLNDYGSY